jgi:hypothetical protein
LFARRDSPPAITGMPKDERIVSWADSFGGEVVAATRRGLWWPTDDTHRLIGWQYVDKAVWRDEALTVVEAEVVDDLLLVDRAPIAVRVENPRDLPATVRKRVEGNVVRSELQPVPGGSARFVARRLPGEDGLAMWVRLEPGTRDEPELREHLRARIALWRQQWEAALR